MCGVRMPNDYSHFRCKYKRYIAHPKSKSWVHNNRLLLKIKQNRLEILIERKQRLILLKDNISNTNTSSRLLLSLSSTWIPLCLKKIIFQWSISWCKIKCLSLYLKALTLWRNSSHSVIKLWFLWRIIPLSSTMVWTLSRRLWNS